MTEEIMKDLSFFVFEGSFGCCDKKHTGLLRCDREHLVLPILGLYSLVLKQRQKPHMKPVLDLINRYKDRFFPACFQFENPDGSTEERDLFRDLTEAMEKRVLQAYEDEQIPSIPCENAIV